RRGDSGIPNRAGKHHRATFRRRESIYHGQVEQRGCFAWHFRMRFRIQRCAQESHRRPLYFGRGAHMKYHLNHLSLAVQLALGMGLCTAAGAIHAQDSAAGDSPTAQQASAQTATQEKAKTLKAVVFTGSLIRRVDAETASPVVTVDRAAITNAGNPTMGNVLQQLPSISGKATNPQNNSNGGGIASPSLEAGGGASR